MQETETKKMSVIQGATQEESAPEESIGVKPVLLEGATVQVLSGEHAGRMGVVMRQNFASDNDYLQFHTAGHPKRMFAKVDSYIVRTRDARNELISVAADALKTLITIDGWGRGHAPETLPGDSAANDEPGA